MTDKDDNPLVHLTQEELDNLKEQLLESIYADIGRNIVKKVLWVLGAVSMVLFTWLSSKHI